MSNSAETRLPGGNDGGAWLRGDVVLRRAGPWTPAVHQLLVEFERAGFESAPRPIGIEPDGREALSYIPGEVPTQTPWPSHVWSERSLAATARMLRRLHDVSVPLATATGLEWQMDLAYMEGAEVICHNDAAPYNTVYRAGIPVAFIDWDWAAPGPRAWDVAHAAYRFVPLMSDEDCIDLGMTEPWQREARFQQFCMAYGVAADFALREMVIERVKAIADLLQRRADAGDPNFARMVREGHLHMYQRHARWLRTSWLYVTEV